MTEYLFIAKPETNYKEVKAGTHMNWSCSATATTGDRALLYITRGQGIIAEWIIASKPWKTKKYYRCKVQFLRDINTPITIDEIRLLAPTWKAVQPNFRGHHSISIPKNIYTRICKRRPGALTSYDTEIHKLNLAIKKSQIQTVFQRNTDVIAEILDRANGFCERCGSAAPFISSATGQPYLEVHHKTRLADGGYDTVKNAIALCPNCHRHEHYA